MDFFYTLAQNGKSLDNFKMKENTLNQFDKLHLDILDEEFKKRKNANSKYSSRQFAEDAGVNPGTMSQYRSGKRKLTPYAFGIILGKLRVDNEIIEKYEQGRIKLELLQEKFLLMKSHWQYYAILELTNLKDFEPSEEWIAQRLGLDLEVTKESIKNLFDIGAMEEVGGTYKDTLGNVTFLDSPDMDVEAGRIYQKQLLEKAAFTIDNTEGGLKDHTSICFALDTSLLPEIKKMTQKYYEEVAHFVEEHSKENNSVYSIQVNVNALTNKKEV